MTLKSFLGTQVAGLPEKLESSGSFYLGQPEATADDTQVSSVALFDGEEDAGDVGHMGPMERKS